MAHAGLSWQWIACEYCPEATCGEFLVELNNMELKSLFFDSKWASLSSNLLQLSNLAGLDMNDEVASPTTDASLAVPWRLNEHEAEEKPK